MAVPHIYIISGEPSGDRLGAKLLLALKRKTLNKIQFSGIGGSEMESHGLISHFPMSELTVMGFTEVIPRLPNLFKRISETVEHIINSQPDLIVTIDSPDFTLRVLKRLRNANIPIVHYVAPSVWAWKPGRARKLAELADHLLTLLPFEPSYFRRVGLNSTFVGHSVIESDAGKGNGVEFRKRHNIPREDSVLCLLAGSRISEINRLLPIFKDAITLLNLTNLRLIMPAVEHTANEISVKTSQWSNPPIIISDEDEKFAAFAASNAAIAASGTVSLELALAKVPYVTVYKFNILTALIAKYMVKTRFVNIINILLKCEVVPELIQSNCNGHKIAKYIIKYLNNPDEAAEQIKRFKGAIAQLKSGQEQPSDLAAGVILDVIKMREKVNLR